MFKNMLLAMLGLIVTTSVFAQERSLYGDARIEDARTNTYYGIEKFILTFPSVTNTDLTASCGGVNKTYGGNSTNTFQKTAEIFNYQQLCGNRPTQLVQIKWRRVSTDDWVIKNFTLPPPGPNHPCNVNIKLTDGVSPESPEATITFTDGCGTPLNLTL